MKAKKSRMLLAVLLGVFTGGIAHAELRVAATVPNMGMLAREVGGSAVTVRVMAPPDRDAHYLEARPSMMAALRRADIVVSIGAELEIGWLPAAITGANNRRVQPGQPGFFEAAQHVKLLWDDKPANRALGDVHPAGNPHVDFDPERMAQIAHALAERLGELQPAKAEYFKANAAAFAEQVAERMPGWRERAQGAPGVLPYHADPDYLLAALDVPILGHIEPLPGIPPTAAHLRRLVQRKSETEGVIWTMNYQPTQAAAFMARELGWKSVQLPAQVGMDGSAADYFAMIDAWVDALKP